MKFKFSSKKYELEYISTDITYWYVLKSSTWTWKIDPLYFSLINNKSI